jgi:hypothetical protein
MIWQQALDGGYGPGLLSQRQRVSHPKKNYPLQKIFLQSVFIHQVNQCSHIDRSQLEFPFIYIFKNIVG